MRIVECDRCHKRIEGTDNMSGYVVLSLQDTRTGDVIGKNEFGDWDFCKDCMKEITEFVRIKPKASAETTTSRKIDVGKIRALAQAGWNKTKIADEVGCSIPTVSKYLQEESDE